MTHYVTYIRVVMIVSPITIVFYMPNTSNLLYRSLFFRILQTLELNIEDMEFLYCFSDTYLPLSREEGKELMAEIKKDEETFGISSLPISFIEWGEEEG